MNVVYIDIDSLRADHLGVYGYDAPTAPNIDELTDDAVWFENAYVANSPCMPSRAAFLSGRYGIHNGVETHGPSAQVLRSPQNQRRWYACWAEDWTKEGRDWLAETNGESRNWLTLPELFFHERIKTCGVSSFPRHTAPWFYHLWHEFRHPQEPDGSGEYMQTPRAETVVDLAIDFIEQNTETDFFLYSQFWDPHAPYNRTDEEIERFRDNTLPTHPTAESIETHRDWDAWRCATQLGVSDRDDLAELLAQYDAEIRYVDQQVGRLLDFLRENGIYDETLIVVTADHGEEFGEHGVYREHWSTHDGTQRVPLIIKPPANESVEGGTRDQLVTNVDVAPTLAEYAGIAPPSKWQGQSLKPIIHSSSTAGRDHIVFDHGLYTAQRAVRTDRWKFIRTYHPGMWSGVTPDQQLYDMRADPDEQTNLADRHPDITSELEGKMAVWAEKHAGIREDTLHTVARNGPAGYELQKHNWKGV